MAISDQAILRVVSSMLFPNTVIVQNVFYSLFNDTGASNDDADVVDDLRDWVDDIFEEIVGNISDEITPGTVKVYVFDTVGLDWDEVGEAQMAFSPLAVEDMLPHGVAAVLHAKTIDPDVQAGKFIAGLVEGVQVDGTWTSPILVKLVLMAVEWATAFVGTATGADFDPGVWSVAQNAFIKFSGTEIINAIPGYQRRRKPGVGI